MRRRASWEIAAAMPFVLLALLGGAATPAAASQCPNEARRVEQGPAALGLPDCRAYELVTPGALLSGNAPIRVASGGAAVSYRSTHPTASATTSSYFYLSRRGADGWSLQSLGPQSAGGALFEGRCEANVFLAPDLSVGVFETGWYEPNEPARCKRPEGLVQGEPDPFRNVFRYDVGSNSYQLINAPPPSATPGNAQFEDASDDMSRVVFAEQAQLTPEAPPGYDFYLWSNGTLRLLTVLPDGTPATGELVEAIPGSGFAPLSGALSSDGHRAFFYANGNLYLRLNADQPQSAITAGHCTEPQQACTLQLDASQGPGASGGGNFWRATADGRTVFFTDSSRLTPDSTAAPGKADLYRFDLVSEQLTDLTVSAGEAADVRGVSGISTDGSYVYFVANGALAAGASAGNCPGTSALPGHCSLYVSHAGVVEFIARLSRADAPDWQENPETPLGIHKPRELSANLSPNGRNFAFLSTSPLTGYDSTDAKTGKPDTEIFLFEAPAEGGAGSLNCVSCPTGPATDPTVNLIGAGNYGSFEAPAVSWMTTSVLDDGSVFFNTRESLAPADTDGLESPYLYRGGETRLLVPSDNAKGSRFLGASPDGTDAFFSTGQQLLGRDGDSGGLSLYDARRDGGFAEPPPPVPCEGSDCRVPIVAVPAQLVSATHPSGVTPKRRCHGKKHCPGRKPHRRHRRRHHRGPRR